MSEFWKRKMKTYFKVLDFDKDGYLSEADFGEFGRRLGVSRKTTDDKREELSSNTRSVWRKYMKSVDLKSSKQLTVEILIESMKKQLYDPDFVTLLNQVLRRLLKVLDVNQDGYLQPEEHKGFFDGMGFPEESFDRRLAFDAMDTNHDNKLSFDEFVRAYFDFMFSQDESSPNKFFIGPLVD